MNFVMLLHGEALDRLHSFEHISCFITNFTGDEIINFHNLHVAARVAMDKVSHCDAASANNAYKNLHQL